MKALINGREYDIPVDEDGTVEAKTLWKVAGIPESRAMIVQNRDGSNTVINLKDRLGITPGQHFLDQPEHKRGA